MSKKPKLVAETKPKLFKMPFTGMRYLIIQDHAQLQKLESGMAQHLSNLLPADADQRFLATTWFTHVPDEGYICVIYYPDMLTDEANKAMVILCHECVHVWQSFHKEVLCESQPSDEFEAYTVDQIFANALKERDRLRLCEVLTKNNAAISCEKTAA